MAKPLSWWEIQVLCAPELEELVCWRLEDFGCRGTASEKSGDHRLIKGYLYQEQVSAEDLKALVALVQQDVANLDFPLPSLQWQVIQEEDWADNWKQSWQPQAVGDRFIVYPAWLTPPEPSDRLVLRLDPGVAFGTGTHPTTQLCLEALEYCVPTHATAPTVADVGCGSGILSIGAVLLGAAKVYAVDTDPLAVYSTVHNWELNQLNPGQLVVAQGSVAVLLQRHLAPVDGIVCNILAPVIIELMPELTALARLGSWAILSGLLTSQAVGVIEAATSQGWAVTNEWQKQDWSCLGLRKH